MRFKSLWQKFKASRFAKFFKRTFKKQEDLTAHEIALLILVLLIIVAASPAIAATKVVKKK